MFKQVNLWLESLNKAVLVFLAFILIVLVASLDYLTGEELSFSIFYLIPVAFSAWYLRLRFGLFISLLSAATWFSVDLYLSEHHYTHFSIPFWNTGVRFGFFIIVTFLLERLQKDLELQEALAQLDGLTGLRNGRAFKHECGHYFDLASRNQHSVCLAYIDLDGFKGINDKLGHSVGDQVLRVVAETMDKRMRTSDIAARMGGDEFAIFLPETNLAGATIFFNDLQENLLEKMKDNTWDVGFSVGVAVFNSPEKSMDDAIRCADALMYQVKKSGKNRILFEEYGTKV